MFAFIQGMFAGSGSRRCRNRSVENCFRLVRLSGVERSSLCLRNIFSGKPRSGRKFQAKTCGLPPIKRLFTLSEGGAPISSSISKVSSTPFSLSDDRMITLGKIAGINTSKIISSSEWPSRQTEQDTRTGK